MKALFLSLLVAISLGACTQESGSAGTIAQPETTIQGSQETPQRNAISSQEAKTLLENNTDVVILDVRTLAEYKAGHLKNAQLLDIYSPDFSAKLKALNPAKTYLVYCAVGSRSQEAAQQMRQLGFQKVYDATDGFNALKKAGIAVEYGSTNLTNPL